MPQEPGSVETQELRVAEAKTRSPREIWEIIGAIYKEIEKISSRKKVGLLSVSTGSPEFNDGIKRVKNLLRDEGIANSPDKLKGLYIYACFRYVLGPQTIKRHGEEFTNMELRHRFDLTREALTDSLGNEQERGEIYSLVKTAVWNEKGKAEQRAAGLRDLPGLLIAGASLDAGEMWEARWKMADRRVKETIEPQVNKDPIGWFNQIKAEAQKQP